MTDREWWLVAGGLLLLGLLVWRFSLLRKRLRIREHELAAIDAEEHRMFDFLHHLGESIAEERSLAHLYRTIVEGIEEVLNADGAALYLLNDEEFSPGHLSKTCPALITVPKEARLEGEEATRKWLRLGRVPREGEFLDTVLDEVAGCRWARGEQPLPDGIEDYFGVPLSHAGKVFGVLSAVRKDRRFSSNDWDIFRSAAEQSAFGLGNALLHREVQEKRRMDDELRTAQEVQKVLLPDRNPDWPGYRVRGINFAARLISGDYFDFVDLADERHGVVIADVSGKGVAAGLVMASCRSALRAHALVANSPSETLAALNRQVFADVREDMFVSAAYAQLENGTGKITLARAGHDAPLLYRKEEGKVEVVKPGGLALGIDRGPVFERVLKELEIEMNSGDVLLFYTDGVNEAENTKGQEFGKERLRERFAALAVNGAEGVVGGLPAELKDFAGSHPQIDDITLVAIERI
ncbi:SpoIIE family protein phosphatase [Roseibacillus persicicus]|uniref:PP2C family protein-serine/threonine phosphatase n=1 Tax=Roseibacillus persicicus TaxID=454148 RepID=UPI00398B321C